MRDSSVWRRLLGVENVIVEGVRLEQRDLVVAVRLYRRQRNRCGRCGTAARGHRAYLLKEHLRLVFQLPFIDAFDLLAEWLDWAVRSHLQPFVDVAHRVAEHIEALIAAQQPERLVDALHPRQLALL